MDVVNKPFELTESSFELTESYRRFSDDLSLLDIPLPRRSDTNQEEGAPSGMDRDRARLSESEQPNGWGHNELDKEVDDLLEELSEKGPLQATSEASGGEVGLSATLAFAEEEGETEIIKENFKPETFKVEGEHDGETYYNPLYDLPKESGGPQDDAMHVVGEHGRLPPGAKQDHPLLQNVAPQDPVVVGVVEEGTGESTGGVPSAGSGLEDGDLSTALSIPEHVEVVFDMAYEIAHSGTLTGVDPVEFAGMVLDLSDDEMAALSELLGPEGLGDVSAWLEEEAEAAPNPDDVPTLIDASELMSWHGEVMQAVSATRNIFKHGNLDATDLTPEDYAQLLTGMDDKQFDAFMGRFSGEEGSQILIWLSGQMDSALGGDTYPNSEFMAAGARITSWRSTMSLDGEGVPSDIAIPTIFDEGDHVYQDDLDMIDEIVTEGTLTTGDPLVFANRLLNMDDAYFETLMDTLTLDDQATLQNWLAVTGGGLPSMDNQQTMFDASVRVGVYRESQLDSDDGE